MFLFLSGESRYEGNGKEAPKRPVPATGTSTTDIWHSRAQQATNIWTGVFEFAQPGTPYDFSVHPTFTSEAVTNQQANERQRCWHKIRKREPDVLSLELCTDTLPQKVESINTSTLVNSPLNLKVLTSDHQCCSFLYTTIFSVTHSQSTFTVPPIWLRRAVVEERAVHLSTSTFFK